MRKIYLLLPILFLFGFLIIASCTDDDDDDVTTGTLIVTTSPSGLSNDIYVDGEMKGTETVTLDLNPGRYLVEGGDVAGYNTPDRYLFKTGCVSRLEV